MKNRNQGNKKKPAEPVSKKNVGNRTGRTHSSKQCHQRQSCQKKEDGATDLLRQIEIVKREWEKTMDCVGEMVILTDSDGIIKRVNKPVKAFTQKSYKEILGSTWEDLIIENELEAVTIYAGCTELNHKPSGRWFELNAYPFEDDELDFSGNVLTIHETTELKEIAEKLARSNKKIEKNRKALQSTLTKICSLIESVIHKKDKTVRFPNQTLKKCYEVKNCTKEDCPCYGKEAMRCWQVAGTFCNSDVQGAFAQKYGSCTDCEVYKEATADSVYQIGEHFNNMMHILDSEDKES